MLCALALSSYHRFPMEETISGRDNTDHRDMVHWLSPLETHTDKCNAAAIGVYAYRLEVAAKRLWGSATLKCNNVWRKGGVAHVYLKRKAFCFCFLNRLVKGYTIYHFFLLSKCPPLVVWPGVCSFYGQSPILVGCPGEKMALVLPAGQYIKHFCDWHAARGGRGGLCLFRQR